MKPCETAARMFCIANGNLTGEHVARWYIANKHRIIRHSHKPGPFIQVVHSDRLELVVPPGVSRDRTRGTDGARHLHTPLHDTASEFR